MRYNALLALGASAGVIASPLNSAAAAQNVQVTLHFLKGDNAQPSIAAYNNDRSKVIGHSCSTSLVLGTSSIAFAVDQNGSGNITVGEKEYRVLDDPKVSGGIVCGRIHNDLETVVNCELAVPAALDLTPLDRRNFPECMSKRSANAEEGLGLEAVLDGFHRKPEFLPVEQPLEEANEISDNSTLSERQICGVTSKGTYRIGDGNPHQNPLNIQLSVRLPFPLYLFSLHCLPRYSPSAVEFLLQ